MSSPSNTTASLNGQMVWKKKRVVPSLGRGARAARKWTAGFWHQYQWQVDYFWTRSP